MSNPFFEPSKPSDRVIRVTNVHFDATVEQLLTLFSSKGTDPFSASRGRNPKSGKNDVAYLYMATRQNCITAQQLIYLKYKGRLLNVIPTKTGLTCDFQMEFDGVRVLMGVSLLAKQPLPRARTYRTLRLHLRALRSLQASETYPHTLHLEARKARQVRTSSLSRDVHHTIT